MTSPPGAGGGGAAAAPLSTSTAARAPARTLSASPRTRACIPEVLLDLHAGDRTCDHELLDLGGSLEDVVDLGVAVPALDRELACVAVASQDLDRALGHPYRHLAGLELAHRALGVFEALPGAAHPRGPPHQQPGGVDLELHA